MGHQSEGSPAVRAAAVDLVRALMFLHGLTPSDLGLVKTVTPRAHAAPRLADAPVPPVPAPPVVLQPAPAPVPVVVAAPSAQRTKATRVNRRTDLGSFAVKPSQPPAAAASAVRDGVKVTVCPAGQDTRYCAGPDFTGGEFMADWRRRRGG